MPKTFKIAKEKLAKPPKWQQNTSKLPKISVVGKMTSKGVQMSANENKESEKTLWQCFHSDTNASENKKYLTLLLQTRESSFSSSAGFTNQVRLKTSQIILLLKTQQGNELSMTISGEDSVSDLGL